MSDFNKDEYLNDLPDMDDLSGQAAPAAASAADGASADSAESAAVAAGGEKYCDGRDRESEPLSEEVCLHSHSKRIGIAGGVTRRRSLSTQFFLKKQNPLP